MYLIQDLENKRIEVLVEKKLGGQVKYRTDMPEELLTLMATGAKDSWIYAEWGISKSTFYRWMQEYPELKEAHEVGLPLCEKAWEQLGMKLMGEGNAKAFNYWKTFMAKKFSGWSQQSLNTGDTQININNMNVLSSKDDQELIEFIQQKLLDVNIIDVVANVTPEIKEINESERQESE